MLSVSRFVPHSSKLVARLALISVHPRFSLVQRGVLRVAVRLEGDCRVLYLR